MPGFALHYLFGTKVYRALPQNDLKKAIKNYPKAYGLGLQGPDIFFYYIPAYIGKRNIGSMMHKENAGAFFHAMLDYRAKTAARKDEDILTAYIAGFLGHYALDSCFHPFVYARTGYSLDKPKDREYYGKHFALETALDVYYLKKWKKTTPEKFYQTKTISLSPREQHAVTSMLQSVIPAVYQHPATKAGLEGAVYSMRLGTFLLHDSTGIKKKMIGKIEQRIFHCFCLSPVIETTEQIDKESILNHNHEIWSNPWDDRSKSGTSAEDIMKAAAIYGSRLFSCFNLIVNGGSWEPLQHCIGNKSFHSGLEISENVERSI